MSVDDWLSYLNNADPLIAVPLVIIGVALMIYGWRLWRICVMLSFGLIGAVVATTFAHTADDRWLYGVIGGGVLAIGSAYPVNHSVSVLAGLLGVGIVWESLIRFGLTGVPFWCMLSVVFIGFTAFGYINRHRVVVLVTAFLGASLVLSAAVPWLKSSPQLYNTFRSLRTDYRFVLPFVVLVPTIVSAFFQTSEINSVEKEV